MDKTNVKEFNPMWFHEVKDYVQVDMKDKNRLLKEPLESMKNKLDEVAKTTNNVKEKLNDSEDKGKIVDWEDDILEPNPHLHEEPFLKAIKALGDKVLEGISLFSGNMEHKLVIECIEGIENYFEFEEITKSLKMKVPKSRLRGSSLTWWKFLQEERENEGKKPKSN